MNISVIICTYNRGALLKECILSVINQSITKEQYEIVVIDNNSSDNTAEIIMELNKEIVRKIRYIKETNIGLSYARNRGISEAKGDILAYIDDDVIVDKNWVDNISNIYDKNKNISCVAGKIEPYWCSKKPDWLEPKLEGTLALLDYGSEIKELLPPKAYPAGANFSFKAEIAKNIGEFRTDLGYKGNNLCGFEEYEFCDRISKAGYKIFYSPEIKVKHIISENRLTKSYFKRRWFYEGAGEVIYKDEEKTNSKPKAFKYLFKNVSHLIKYMRGILMKKMRRQEIPFIWICDFYKISGRCYQVFKLFFLENKKA